jgi:sulfatase maturation enzyme AslB (radical SAM superfamily)
MTDAYCSMIHGGLQLDFQHILPAAQSCCLRKDLDTIDTSKNFWHDDRFRVLREKNKINSWDPGCSNCERLEKSGYPSMRTGMNQGLSIYPQTELSGPARIDLMVDISCNLACRTCNPHSSTFWQKHLKENQLWSQPIFSPKRSQEVIDSLQKLDLSNLRQVVFCGGETMLGQSYWDIADWLANTVPNAQQRLTVCFQTNGTQTLSEKNIATIEKLHLVKMHISLDGVREKFEYLRWPASWNQVTENILHLKQTAPSNVMFLIEETVSIFNLWYGTELSTWLQQNFTTNREGDPVDHTKHLAKGVFSLANCSSEYIIAMADHCDHRLIPPDWNEKPALIQHMIKEIKKADQLRGQCFEKTFPELAEFYQRFL